MTKLSDKILLGNGEPLAPVGVKTDGGISLPDDANYTNGPLEVNRQDRINKGDKVTVCVSCKANECRYGRSLCEACLGNLRKPFFKGIRK